MVPLSANWREALTIIGKVWITLLPFGAIYRRAEKFDANPQQRSARRIFWHQGTAAAEKSDKNFHISDKLRLIGVS